MKPAKYDFGEYTSEDTVKARVIAITRTDSDDQTEDEVLTDVVAYLTFRDSEGDQKLQMTNGDGLNISGNEITIESFHTPKAPDTYKHDLELNYPDGSRFTYMKGTIVVTQGVTRE